MTPILEQIAQCNDNDRIIIERRVTDKSSGTTSFTAGELKSELVAARVQYDVRPSGVFASLTTNPAVKLEIDVETGFPVVVPK